MCMPESASRWQPVSSKNPCLASDSIEFSVHGVRARSPVMVTVPPLMVRVTVATPTVDAAAGGGSTALAGSPLTA